ncbi:hypothetical protein [Halalkalibacter sp. APA_J-10(15)]|uniref:hypothetical protein n=1 Tax=Halalkalibacter sp. APA_J-10(15) TaxID=2933805 RepID=UPI001FF1A8D0|nr:hypothetical protein [Halalkalibacter sp. APA_J-10(15)]MCK0472519.1 hypothetical protein [Halalkalibacter sp. APA_J-10(15)]
MNQKEARALKADKDYWKNLCKELSNKDSDQVIEIERYKKTLLYIQQQLKTQNTGARSKISQAIEDALG